MASTVPAEIDNLRLALDWLGEQGESALELEMVAQLGKFWRDWGLLAEGKQRLEHALSRAPAEPSSELVWALIALGVIHEYEGDFSAALPFDERALDAARMLEDDTLVLRALEQPRTLPAHGRGLRRRRDPTAGGGEARGGRGRRIRAAAGLWKHLVWAAITRGDWEEARTRCERVIELASETGSEYVLAVTRGNLGWALVHLGDESAEAQFLSSLEHAPWYGPRETAECLSGLAAVAASDRPEHAARLQGLADAIEGEEGVVPEPFVRDVNEQTVANLRATLGDDEFERLRAEGAALDRERTIEQLLGH